jgi:hypothetical protein
MNGMETLSPHAARLEPTRQELESAIKPLVEDLSSIPSLNSAVLFALDPWHLRSAGAVAQVYAPDRPDETQDFTKKNIQGHRVDTNPSTTTVGKTFESHQSQFNPSLMNPDEHVVWGAYTAPAGDNQAAVLQLAFDKLKALPSEKTLAEVWKQYEKSISEATESLIRANIDRMSLSNDLLLDTPVTPNAFIIKWDVTKSTEMAHRQYPLFRQYLDELEQYINFLVEAFEGRIVSYNGDGQNIVVDLPTSINRNNPVEIGVFGQSTAAPLVNAIVKANAKISHSYAALKPHIRVGLGLGHVELSEKGENTGLVFWETAEAIESLPRDYTSIRFTDITRHALIRARRNK